MSDKLSLESALRKFVRRWYETGGEEWRSTPADQREETIDQAVDEIARRLVADHFGCSPDDL